MRSRLTMIRTRLTTLWLTLWTLPLLAAPRAARTIPDPRSRINIGQGAEEGEVPLAYPITGHFRLDAHVAAQLCKLGS